MKSSKPWASQRSTEGPKGYFCRSALFAIFLREIAYIACGL